MVTHTCQGMIICICVYSEHFQQSMDQPGMVYNPARSYLIKENTFFSVPVRA